MDISKWNLPVVPHTWPGTFRWAVHYSSTGYSYLHLEKMIEYKSFWSGKVKTRWVSLGGSELIVASQSPRLQREWAQKVLDRVAARHYPNDLTDGSVVYARRV